MATAPRWWVNASSRVMFVAVIGSLYPATTLLIAHFLLKERMSGVQWAGVALALGAVVALTV
jgi:drug/metabolite transporter (DMT)-like permease